MVNDIFGDPSQSQVSNNPSETRSRANPSRSGKGVIMGVNLGFVNPQAPEHVEWDTEGHLDVHSVFYTLQGEGPFSGMPSVFLRLAGCNLQCPFCDTDYTTGRQKMTPDDLIETIRSKVPKSNPYTPILVITGGEPFRQNLIPFLKLADTARFTVQIETNGTVFPSEVQFHHLRCRPHIVCSPKTPKLHSSLKQYIRSLKYIVSVREGYNEKTGIPKASLGMHGDPCPPWPTIPACEVYIQPCDQGDKELNHQNAVLAASICLQFGYTFCYQLHKLVGLE